MIPNKYLFARKSKLHGGHTVLCAVEAYGKDHAIKRLCTHYPYTDKKEWEFLDNLDPEHFCGALGDDLPLLAHEIFARRKTLLN